MKLSSFSYKASIWSLLMVSSILLFSIMACSAVEFMKIAGYAFSTKIAGHVENCTAGPGECGRCCGGVHQ